MRLFLSLHVALPENAMGNAMGPKWKDQIGYQGRGRDRCRRAGITAA